MLKKNKKSNDWNITSKINLDDILTVMLFSFGILAILAIIIVTIVVAIKII